MADSSTSKQTSPHTLLSPKIIALDSIADKLENLRKGKKVVHCHGVFDLLHVGHIRHLKEARSFGDILVVSITADVHVNKGPHRPAFTDRLRAESLAALECVDYVVVADSPSAVEAIQAIKPAMFVRGQEYKTRPDSKSVKLKLEKAALEACGGEIVFTDDIIFSSTNLINKHLSAFPDQVEEYLNGIRDKYSPDYFETLFDRISDARVLVVGEAIVDDYHYCDVIGKAGKEPVLVGQYRSSERFAGGSLAVAKHLAGFCKTVGVFATLGTGDATDFVKSSMPEEVHSHFIMHDNRPTIVKRRFVEGYLMQKLFEVYFMENQELSPSEEGELCSKLEETIAQYDIIIVADYGHGMLTRSARELLSGSDRFLAINTQANAGNKGFHTVSTYPKADYISLSREELKLEFRSPNGTAKEMIAKLPLRIKCPYITVTLGKDGILSYQEAAGFAQAPAMTQFAVDRVGSGDAVFALTSPLAWLGIEPEVLAFIGNIAGAEAVRTVGHRSSINRRSFLRHIASLLK